MNLKKTTPQWMTVLGLAGTILLSACSNSSTQVQEVSILPLPNRTVKLEGSFVLPKQCTISISDTSLKPAADYLVSILSKSTDCKCTISEGKGDINLTLSGEGKEGSYCLKSTHKDININASSYAGIIYGIESLRQLLPAQIELTQNQQAVEWVIPSVEIEDSPRYSWRGIMLDVSRHFYDKEEVKELLDIMALYKMNKFHWHLTDDQGWRVEIKQYPLLTEKGAWRKYNSHDKGCLERAQEEANTDFLIPNEKIRIAAGDTLYGGFYTQDDIKEIVSYAQIRGIDIIPEVDMPGHMLAAVSNYDGVSCFKETGWGSIFSSPVCPGKDSALEFCKNVYKEIIPLFPYKYIHIGGDEVEKTNWKKCTDCQKRIKQHGLKSEEELQSWFIHEMEAFFNANGKEMIGWDEIIEGGLSKTATVMWWRSWSKDAPAQTTGQGNQIIFTPNTQFYLDYQQDSKSLPKIYNFNPDEEIPATASKELILGVQGNIWCEWIPSRERLHYMAMPRLQAIAELGWSNPAQKDWEGFKSRLVRQFERMSMMNINYRIPDLEGFHKVNAFIGEGNVSITCMDPSAEVHYTTDGSIPTLQSPKYEGNLKVTETTDFTFRTFTAKGKPQDIVTTRFVKSESAPASEVTPTQKGLLAQWYDYKGNKCTEITDAKLKGTYTVSEVTIPEGVTGNIGLILTGYIHIPADGIYTFALNSDDGSTLSIGGEMIIDNDGPHSQRELIGQKALAKGYHPIEVRYFDHNGGMLEMKVKNNEGNVLGESVFAHQ